MENFKLLERVECVSVSYPEPKRGTIVAAGFRVNLANPSLIGTDLVPYVVVELDEGYYIPQGGYSSHLVCHPSSVVKV